MDLRNGRSRAATLKGSSVSLSYLLVVSAIVMSLGVTACGGAGDTVTLTNDGSGENGILVDGTKAGSTTNDDTFTGAAGAAIDVGEFEASSGEIIGYTNQRPPLLIESVPWTGAVDAISEAFESKYRVPFFVWIVKGPFVDQQTLAIDACVKTAQIWGDERQGIGFSTFTINDATGDADAATFHDFDCSMVADLKSDIGFDSSGINVYYVDTVDFGSGAATTNGVWCGGDLVAMGRNTSDHLFSHEIGHGFALSHTNGLTTNFDTTNVMHNASNNRNYLTEGQSFRAIIVPGSAVNGTYNLRPGETTRACGGTAETATAECPEVQKRIWADGAGWPPN